jgi:hypothetical protein
MKYQNVRKARSKTLDEIDMIPDFLKLSANEKRKFCKRIVDRLILTMPEEFDREKKLKVMKLSFNESIEMEEKNEEYENCFLYQELIKAIDEIV